MMMIHKRTAQLLAGILLAGFTYTLPTQAQSSGRAWESSSQKGKAKGSGAVVAKEIAPGGVVAGSVPLVNPNEYLIGESDVLRINVWKEPELSQVVTVRPDGKISLPLINELKVSGLTPLQVESLVATRLKAYIVEPQVNVSLTEMRSKNVYITGEVSRPGSYPLPMPTTVLQLIAKAGGFTPFASRRGVFVLRPVNGKAQKMKIPYGEVVKGKRDDLELRPGDTVVVP